MDFIVTPTVVEKVSNHTDSTLLNAAHERTDTKVTDEMKQQDDDIMDDPDF